MDDYHEWATLMQLLLQAECQWSPSLDNLPRDEQNGSKALLLIYTNVSESIRHFLIGLDCGDALIAWKVLDVRYSVKTSAVLKTVENLLRLDAEDFADENDYLKQLEKHLESLCNIKEGWTSCLSQAGKKFRKAITDDERMKLAKDPRCQDPGRLRVGELLREKHTDSLPDERIDDYHSRGDVAESRDSHRSHPVYVLP